MSKHDQSRSSKPIAIAVGAVLGLSLSASAFAITPLASGYMLAAGEATATDAKKPASTAADKAKGEMSCGANKAKAEGKCGEGKCGAKALAAMDSNKDGKVSRKECADHHDAMFTQADADKDGFVTPAEADAMQKAHAEGKCGEGKCGGEKKGGK